MSAHALQSAHAAAHATVSKFAAGTSLMSDSGMAHADMSVMSGCCH
jgi:hypothetical protein